MDPEEPKRILPINQIVRTGIVHPGEFLRPSPARPPQTLCWTHCKPLSETLRFVFWVEMQKASFGAQCGENEAPKNAAGEGLGSVSDFACPHAAMDPEEAMGVRGMEQLCCGEKKKVKKILTINHCEKNSHNQPDCENWDCSSWRICESQPCKAHLRHSANPYQRQNQLRDLCSGWRSRKHHLGLNVVKMRMLLGRDWRAFQFFLSSCCCVTSCTFSSEFWEPGPCPLLRVLWVCLCFQFCSELV